MFKLSFLHFSPLPIKVGKMAENPEYFQIDAFLY